METSSPTSGSFSQLKLLLVWIFKKGNWFLTVLGHRLLICFRIWRWFSVSESDSLCCLLLPLSAESAINPSSVFLYRKWWNCLWSLCDSYQSKFNNKDQVRNLSGDEDPADHSVFLTEMGAVKPFGWQFCHTKAAAWGTPALKVRHGTNLNVRSAACRGAGLPLKSCMFQVCWCTVGVAWALEKVWPHMITITVWTRILKLTIKTHSNEGKWVQVQCPALPLQQLSEQQVNNP